MSAELVVGERVVGTANGVWKTWGRSLGRCSTGARHPRAGAAPLQGDDRGDAATRDLLHRDLKYTHSSGVVDSKDSYTRGVREKLWDYQSIKTSNETVSVHGDTALVHCRLQIDWRSKAFPGRSTRSP
jgi:hypothetical protein